MQNYAKKYSSISAQTFFFVKNILYASYKQGRIDQFPIILEGIVDVFKNKEHLRTQCSSL